jgi:hypothetical protein
MHGFGDDDDSLGCILCEYAFFAPQAGSATREPPAQAALKDATGKAIGGTESEHDLTQTDGLNAE